MKKVCFLVISISLLILGCKHPNEKKSDIMEISINKIVDSLTAKYGAGVRAMAEKGTRQVAKLWVSEDGAGPAFEKFCIDNFFGNDSLKEAAFNHLLVYTESLSGNFNRIQLDLQKFVQLELGPIQPIDEMFAAYSPGAHFSDDLYKNKIAFFMILNFPHYSLKEKNELGGSWTRKEWAYARFGDMFGSRVPAENVQAISKALSDADMYISDYNIFAGCLVNKENKTLFEKNMKLISHWGLRDEIKANYGKKDGLEKQKIIYEAMKRIVKQEIPKEVINSEKYAWNPYTNKVSENGKEINSVPEPDIRYQKILDNFKALKNADTFYVDLNTFIKQKFEGEMEMPQEEIEKLFVEFVSSPEVKKVAALIKKRLGRDLQPFDLWYDGFKPRSGIANEVLEKTVGKKYPNSQAFKNDMVNILTKLSFERKKAEFIASKIDVDPARGSGHAWGAAMHDMNSHLRTRIMANGMNYKGYNVAIHEFGHTVEQTISMHDMDYFVLAGIPNTAFTEALAFVFQHRDIELLGIKDNNPDKNFLFALDDFWSLYEIMGVSLVDMNVWKWLYSHPDATAAELKNEVVQISKDVWNKYYADVLGSRDEVLLAIYSHMISDPLYLSAYPIGYLIEFQLEQYLEGKNFGKEVERIYSIGKLTPKEWMIKAVGEEVSAKPILKTVDEALVKITN
jgi:hypothetical protein